MSKKDEVKVMPFVKCRRESLNKNLHAAKRNKNDEFYTGLTDIEKELKHYRKHFKNKTVFCNCDDPRVSNFFRYFSYNFGLLKLKKLITTCYKNQEIDLFSENNKEQAIYLEYNGSKNKNEIPSLEETGIKHLKGDGDFRSEECIDLLKQADIVVTNPPFSLFREYVSQLMEYEKKFLIIGNINAVSYKEIFPLIRDNKIWVGYNFNKTMEFGLSPDYERWNRIGKDGMKYGRVPGICWFTNLLHKKRNEELILYKKYKGNEQDYPKYDNYDAIEVSKVVNIPKDYGGAIGVPITFLNKYNPKQFEIVSANDYRTNKNTPFKEHGLIKDKDGAINGKPTYVRIVIRRREN